MSFAAELAELSQQSADERERKVGDILALDFTKDVFRKIRNVLRRHAANEETCVGFSCGPIYEDLVTLRRLGLDMPRLAAKKFIPGVRLCVVEDGVYGQSSVEFRFSW